MFDARTSLVATLLTVFTTSTTTNCAPLTNRNFLEANTTTGIDCPQKNAVENVAMTTSEAITERQRTPFHDSYLRRFGHVSSHLSGSFYKTSALSGSTSASGGGPPLSTVEFREAVRSLQKFAGLKITGGLDSETMDVFQRPRCGRPDVEYQPLPESYTNDSQTTPTGEQPNYRDLRKKRFVALDGWPKNSLTYTIQTAPVKYISKQTTEEQIERAFALWTSVVSSQKLTVKRAKNGQPADIKIDFVSYMHGDCCDFDGPLGVFAHAVLPPYGEVHFDNSELWTNGSTDPRQAENNAVFFYQIALHELGHVLGLSHSTVTSSVMTPFYMYNPSVTLTDDDIQGIQSIYGYGRSVKMNSSLDDLLATSNHASKCLLFADIRSNIKTDIFVQSSGGWGVVKKRNADTSSVGKKKLTLKRPTADARSYS